MAAGDRVNIADKTTLDSVNTKLGTSGDASSSTPATLFAGIKNLIANITTILTRTSTIATDVTTIKTNTQNSSPIKKILSGYQSDNSAVNHEEVNLAKSIILLNAATTISSSPLTSAPSGICVRNRTSTSFSIQSYNSSSSILYYWQIIEFN